MSSLTFEVADVDDLTTRTDITSQVTIPKASANCEDRLNEEGSGGIVLPYGSAISPSPVGKAVIMSVDGTEAFTWIPEAKDETEVAEAEEARMPTEYSGRGLAGLLDRYRFVPPLGSGKFPWSKSRSYSVFSLEYDFSGWGAATEYEMATDLINFFSGEPERPEGFPAFDAWWIGPSEGDIAEAPYGYWRAQTEFTLAEDTWVQFFFTADDDVDLFIDGYRFETLTGGGARARSADTRRIYLSAGTHRIGAKVVNNFGNPNFDPGYGEGTTELGNPTMLLLAGYESDVDGRLGARVTATDDSWKILSYSSSPPGMTDVEVIEAMVADNLALTDHPVPFTVVAHGSFDPVETITVRVGAASLLDHLRDRADAGWFDWRIPPDALEIHLYPAGTLGSASGVVYSTASGNLTHLRSLQQDVGTDALWVTYAGGQFLYPPEGGERIGYREMPTTSIGTAKQEAALILARDPQPEKVDVGIAPTTGDVPWVDVDLGDTLTAGSFTDERAVGLSMSWPSPYGDEPAFGIVLKDRIRGEEERLTLMVARSAPGQLGGDAPASPVDEPSRPTSRVNASEVTFQAVKDASGDFVTGPSEVKRTSASGNLYAIAVTTTAPAASTDTEFEFLVDGVDVLGGNGVLPAGELFAEIWVGEPFAWIVARVTELQANPTAYGTDLVSLLIEPVFVA